MEPSTLLEHWNRNSARPTWVRNHADDLMDYLSVDEPIPETSLHDIQDWVNRYSATVSRQLREAAQLEDADEELDRDVATVGGAE